MNDMFKIIRGMKRIKELYSINDVHPYHHTTFAVKNLNEYIDVIMSFEKEIRKDKSSLKKMVYRGMADENWKLVSSIARKRNFEINEKEMIREFKYTNPNIFFGLGTNFEVLSYMQHYGLPTRLLDFTENPLVALYFACKEMKKSNGRIVCLYDYIDCSIDKYANILCDIACNSDINEKIDLYVTKYDLSAFNFLHKMYTGYPYVLVKPPYWNERQKRQKSIFFIFSSLISDAYGQAIYYGYEYDIEKTVRLSIEKHEDFVKIYENSKWVPNTYFKEKYSDKKSLSFVLDRHSWNLLNASYRLEDIDLKEKIFSRRFVLHDQLESMDEDKLENDFCSIIIPAKYKKTILEQLDFIGINEAYVYPEVDYVASEIRNKYE